MHPFRFVSLFLPETSSSYNRLVIILCTLDARTRTILFHLPGKKWTKNCGRIGRTSFAYLNIPRNVISNKRTFSNFPPSKFNSPGILSATFRKNFSLRTISLRSYLFTKLSKKRKEETRALFERTSFGFIDALAFSFDKAFVLPRFISTPRAALIPSPLAKHSNLPWNSLALSLPLSFLFEEKKTRCEISTNSFVDR